jgi:hypothetical protein
MKKNQKATISTTSSEDGVKLDYFGEEEPGQAASQKRRMSQPFTTLKTDRPLSTHR